MARKNRTPEEKARREKIRELLQLANIGSMDDIQNLFKMCIRDSKSSAFTNVTNNTPIVMSGASNGPLILTFN